MKLRVNWKYLFYFTSANFIPEICNRSENYIISEYMWVEIENLFIHDCEYRKKYGLELVHTVHSEKISIRTLILWV